MTDVAEHRDRALNMCTKKNPHVLDDSLDTIELTTGIDLMFSNDPDGRIEHLKKTEMEQISMFYNYS